MQNITEKCQRQGIDTKDFFHEGWFHAPLVGGKKFLFVLWIPIGLFMICFHFCIALLFLIAATCKIPINQYWLGFIHGWNAKIHNKHNLMNMQSMIVTNHRSFVDHTQLYKIVPDMRILANPMTSNWIYSFFAPIITGKTLYIYKTQSTEILKQRIGKAFSKGNHVISFPEATIQTRKYLYHFHKFSFDLSRSVTPIVIKASTFFNANLYPFSKSQSLSMFWMSFQPYVRYNLTVLPPMIRKQGETAQAFAKRIQIRIANEAGYIPTDITHNDKKQYKQECLS